MVSNAVNKSTFAMAGTKRAEMGPCQWKMASCCGDASKMRTLVKAAVATPKQATARDAGFLSEMNAFKVSVYWELKVSNGAMKSWLYTRLRGKSRTQRILKGVECRLNL